MLWVKAHYERLADELSISIKKFADVEDGEETEHVIVLVDSFSQSVIKAINYGKRITNNINAFHVSVEEDATEKLIAKWDDKDMEIPLIIKQ